MNFIELFSKICADCVIILTTYSLGTETQNVCDLFFHYSNQIWLKIMSESLKGTNLKNGWGLIREQVRHVLINYDGYYIRKIVLKLRTWQKQLKNIVTFTFVL